MRDVEERAKARAAESERDRYFRLRATKVTIGKKYRDSVMSEVPLSYFQFLYEYDPS